MNRITNLCIIAVLVSGLAYAQDQERLPEFEKSITVDMVIIDVVVTDNTGNYVRNLKPEDFIVFEDGKRVQVNSVDEYFLEQSLLAADSDVLMLDSPPRNIIFVLDRFFSSESAIQRGREAIVKFCQTGLQPGDRAMLFTYDSNFNLVQDITTNHRALEVAAQGLSNMSNNPDTPEYLADAPSRADSLMAFSTTSLSNRQIETASVDQFQNMKLQQDVRNYFEKLKYLSLSLKAIPGRKTVILLSEGYDQRIMQLDQVNNFGRGPLTEIEEEETNDPSLPTRQVSRNEPLLHFFDDAIDSINDATTSFYVIDIASLESHRSRSDSFQTDTLTKRNDYDNARLNSLYAIAETTGGDLYSGTRDLDGILERINRDTGNYYIIAYNTPNSRRDGKFRDIRVEMADKNLNVKSRKGYHEPKTFNRMNERERYVHLVEGMMQTNPVNELEAEFAYFFLPLYSDTVVASAAVSIPAAEIGGDAEKKIEILGNITDRLNKNVDSFYRTIDYSRALNDIKNDGKFNFKIPFVLRSGANKVKLTVRDNSTGHRFYIFDEVTARGALPDEVYMSSVTFFDENIKPSSIEKFKLDVRDESEKLGLTGFRTNDPLKIFTAQPIFPLIETDFKRSEAPVLFFSAGNFWQDEKTNKINLFIDYVLIDENGNEHVVPVERERLIPVPGSRRVNVLAKLQLASLDPGNYRLRIRFLDQEKLQGVQRFVNLTIN